MAVRVSKRRYESDTYLINPSKQCDVRVNAQPLIISVKTTYDEYVAKERTYTERDVKLLERMFSNLGFKDCIVWTDSDENGPLHSKAKLKENLRKLAQDPAFTSQADMFFAVVLAHGEEGYFYMPNMVEQSGKPSEVLFTEILDIFKGPFCPGLTLKPKILIAQTCDKHLKKVNIVTEYVGGREPSTSTRVPVELDIFCYQSTISGKYMKHIKNKYREFYEKNCTSMDQDSGDDPPATPMIYCLTQTVEEMMRNNGVVNLNQLIITVNRKIEQFIKSRIWRCQGGQKSWSDEELKVPLVSSQLSKELDIRIQNS